jgi:tellurite resistance protein tehA
LILLGTAGQLAFAMYRAGGLWRGVHNLDATTPIVYLPTVATNFVSATAMATLGLSDYAWLFWARDCFHGLAWKPPY